MIGRKSFAFKAFCAGEQINRERQYFRSLAAMTLFGGDDGLECGSA